jgi:hypothetical protein
MSELASESVSQCAWSLVPGPYAGHCALPTSLDALIGAEPA